MAGQVSSGGSDKQELPAVRTTIVGGRPPGCGKPLGEIPRGIEVLVKKAAVDPAFRRLLLARRGGAAAVIGLALQPAEAALLEAVPARQLRAIIDRTRVAPEVRPAFLGKAAAVMLVALGVSTFEASAQVQPSNGVRAVQKDPASAPAQPQVPTGVEVAGIRAPRSEPTTQPASRPASQPAAPPISPAEFDRLIKQLDAGDYKQREEAQAKLQAQMPGLTARLEQALKVSKLSPEQKNRIEVILEKFKPARPSEIRAMRGVRMEASAGVRAPVAEVRTETTTKPKEDESQKKGSSPN